MHNAGENRKNILTRITFSLFIDSFYIDALDIYPLLVKMTKTRIYSRYVREQSGSLPRQVR